MDDLSKYCDSCLLAELMARTIEQNKKQVDGGLLKLLKRMAVCVSPDQAIALVEAMRNVSDEIERAVMLERAKV
jgi:hypothetical protein